MTDLSARDQFFAAVQGGDTAAVTRMLDADPSLATAKNQQGLSPVLLAAYMRQPAVRDLLLARGVVLELHEAAAAGQLGRVQQIVQANPALATSYSPDGFPIVALAAFCGNLPIVRHLVEKGADINAAANNGSGYNALTGAVTTGQTETVAWLLANNADPNYHYGPGYTPLHAAAAGGHLEIVKLLIRHGANLQAKTTEGKTALAIAEERKHLEVADYLRAVSS
jgi:ankyrin repeat protein